MGNVLVKEETLTEIADSIREKNGLSDKYKPAEMPEAIKNIQAGGGVEKTVSEDAPIRFFGFEGDLLYSYSLEEVMELTALPPLPAREGMTCQGWNWTMEDIQNEGKEVDVGAVFITDDGVTRIYVELTEDTLSPYLGFAQVDANSVYVDWGDGSELEMTEVCGRTTDVNMHHQYAEPGNYVIRLIPEENAQIYFLGTANKGASLLKRITSADSGNRVYNSAVKKIELGSNIVSMGDYSLSYTSITGINIPEGTEIGRAFNSAYRLKNITFPRSFKYASGSMCYYCYSLERAFLPPKLSDLDDSMFSKCYSLKELIVPDSVLVIYAGALGYCHSLKRVVLSRNMTKIHSGPFNECRCVTELLLPDTITEMRDNIFEECSSLEKVRLPSGITELNDYLLQNCSRLRELEIPVGVTRIGTSSVYGCQRLTKLVIPESVTEIDSNAFSNNYGMQNYYFMPKTPPTLLYKSAFSSMSADCKIHVPKGYLEAYQVATYWSDYADYLVEMEE